MTEKDHNTTKKNQFMGYKSHIYYSWQHQLKTLLTSPGNRFETGKAKYFSTESFFYLCDTDQHAYNSWELHLT